jgi:hypothetical protein
VSVKGTEGDGMAMEVQFFAFYFVILLFFAIFAK